MRIVFQTDPEMNNLKLIFTVSLQFLILKTFVTGFESAAIFNFPVIVGHRWTNFTWAVLRLAADQSNSRTCFVIQ